MGLWIEPTPNAYQRASCMGKVAYASAKQADKAVKRQLRRDNHRPICGERLERYRCRFCGEWHIGHAQR